MSKRKGGFRPLRSPNDGPRTFPDVRKPKSLFKGDLGEHTGHAKVIIPAEPKPN